LAGAGPYIAQPEKAIGRIAGEEGAAAAEATQRAARAANTIRAAGAAFERGSAVSARQCISADA